MSAKTRNAITAKTWGKNERKYVSKLFGELRRTQNPYLDQICRAILSSSTEYRIIKGGFI
jgi:hypothetical protein